MTDGTVASLRDADSEILLKITRAIGNLPKTVYAPSEDSHLMLEAIARLPVEGKRLLDVGTGSGILGLFCAMRGAQVTVTDVDEAALRAATHAANTLKLNIETILSNVFSNVQGLFDLIIFNPPYLPSSTVEDRTVDGGQGGIMLSTRFLDGLNDHLNCSGTALLLVSSLNDAESLISQYSAFQFTVMAKRALFFEELRVLSIRFRDKLAS